jgi:hypothetical protein
MSARVRCCQRMAVDQRTPADRVSSWRRRRFASTSGAIWPERWRRCCISAWHLATLKNGDSHSGNLTNGLSGHDCVPARQSNLWFGRACDESDNREVL